MEKWTKSAGTILAVATMFAAFACPQSSAQTSKLTIEQLIDIKHPSNPEWSPDGKHVVFTWDRAGVANLFVANVDGRGQVVAVTSFSEGQIDDAFWSRDSQTIFFPHNGDLWQVAVSGGAPKPVWTTPTIESEMVPSPDGARVAFVRHIAGVPDGDDHKSELVVRSLGDGGESVVAQDKVSIRRPIWSPDGASLAAICRESEKARTFRPRSGARDPAGTPGCRPG